MNKQALCTRILQRCLKNRIPKTAADRMAEAYMQKRAAFANKLACYLDALRNDKQSVTVSKALKAYNTTR